MADRSLESNLKSIGQNLALLAGLTLPGLANLEAAENKPSGAPAAHKKVEDDPALSLSELKIPGHAHGERGGCHAMCPKQGEPGYNSIVNVLPEFSTERKSIARTLGPSDIVTWTKLEDMPKEMRDFLIAWDKSTTIEEIRHVTNPETAAYLKNLPENARRWAHPEFLIWLKDCIKDGKLPCETYMRGPESFSGESHRGTLSTSVSKDGRFISPDLVPEKNLPEGAKAHFRLELRKDNFTNLPAEMARMEKMGGFGIFFVPDGRGASGGQESIRPGGYGSFLHELTHLYERIHGYPYSKETGPEMSKFIGLVTISREDYQKYFKPVFVPGKND